MADELKIPQFSKQKKLKAKTEAKEAGSGVIDYHPVPAETNRVYIALTEEQIESCRKGQDIFDFARDIEELVRINNQL